MTHYILTAYDHTDAMERRMSARAEHVKCIDRLRDSGKALFGGPLIDESGKMIGSTILFAMSKDELEEYLKIEPYVTEKVWDRIETKACKIGPSFLSKFN